MYVRLRPHNKGGTGKGRFHSENTSNVFIHATPDEVKIATIAGILDKCLKKTRSIKSLDYRVYFVLKTFCYQNVFRLHKNEN